MKYTTQAEMHEYLTDKHFPHTYAHMVYNDLFEPIQGEVKKYLEIGVHYGGSVLLARDYFYNATVYGSDIKAPNWRLKDAKRIIHVMGDGYSKEVADMFPNDLDIIIEDGSHRVPDQIKALQLYVPKLKVGGYLIIEDILQPIKENFEKLDEVMKYFDGYEVTKYEGPGYFRHAHSSHEEEAMKEIKEHGELVTMNYDDNLYIVQRIK